jgi:predicted permease
LAIGLGFKLVLVPLVLFLLYVPLLGAQGQAIQITLFQAGMPPMITAAILATEHDLDPPLATLMVTVGLMLSFVTLTGWWWLMQGV